MVVELPTEVADDKQANSFSGERSANNNSLRQFLKAVHNAIKRKISTAYTCTV